MQTQVITNLADLHVLRSEWDHLLGSSAADSIFLTWEWIEAWLDAVRPGARLLVVAVRDANGRLAAVAPFYQGRLRLVGVMPYRCLRVLGDEESGAEYPDLIVRRGGEDEFVPHLAQALLEQRNAWDCLWLPSVSGWTGVLKRTQELCRSGGFRLHARSRDFAALDLPPTHEAYMQSLSHKRRAYLRREWRNLKASGRVEWLRAETESHVSELHAALFDLHQRRWSAVGQSGAFLRTPRLVRFYERFAASALRRGWLRVFGLNVDGRWRAVQYGYAYHGTFYALQEGYDPDLPGVGNLLRNLVFKACIAEGLARYDFLADCTEHKRLWRAEPRYGHDLFIGRPTLKNTLLFTRPVWPTGRFLNAWSA